VIESQRQHRQASHLAGLARLEPMQGEPRPRGSGRERQRIVEDVSEGAGRIIERSLGPVYRDRRFPPQREHPQVVDAVDVVGVLVGVEHGVKPVHTFAHQLEAQLGRGVDQESRIAGLDDRGGPAAPVPGVGGSAHGAPAPDLGHPE
jgi:hypothetical protein